MKRISVLTADSSLSQENSHVSLLNKKFCTQGSKQSSFPGLNQTFAAVGAASQQQQTSSLQYQPSDHLLQQFISSQLTRTLPVGENLTNIDFPRLETREDKSTMQPVVYNISDNFFQDQFALIPMSLRNNGVGAYNNSFNRDLNLNNLFSLNNNNSALSYMSNIQPQSNLQGQHLSIQLNQQRPFDKLYNQTKREEEDSSHQAFADEMELRISELLSSQNKMLTDFKEKNHLLQDSLKTALDEIKGLNHAIKHQNHAGSGKVSTNPLRTHQAINNSNDTASSELLISYLCGPDTDFEYHLILKTELQLPLYRERNFKFTVVLTDKQGNVVQDLEEFPLTLSIYTSENPPKSIETNNSGNKVLKGVNVKSMIHGVATFEKIQIKEVTSHLRNGWIFLVVQPMNLQNEKNTSKSSLNSSRGKRSVDIKKIKPLVIDKIVVKAKKLKEKDNSEENEDN